MSDQPELKEFPEFPGEPMSKRYDTTRIANAIPSIHPIIHSRSTTYTVA
jgi:hypothetical protein